MIPQPQKQHWMINLQLQQSMQCPPKVKLRPLSNGYLLPGSSRNHTFLCDFEVGKIRPFGHIYNKPVHNVTIRWYFSNSFNFGSNQQFITNNSKHFRLSPDQRTLTVVGATKKQEGCYKVVVVNKPPGDRVSSTPYENSYEILEEKGYLFLNKTSIALPSLSSSEHYFSVNSKVLVAVVTSVGLFLLIVLSVSMHLWRKKYYSKTHPISTNSDYLNTVSLDQLNISPSEPILPSRPSIKVHLSHCSETPTELQELLD